MEKFSATEVKNSFNIKLMAIAISRSTGFLTTEGAEEETQRARRVSSAPSVVKKLLQVKLQPFNT